MKSKHCSLFLFFFILLSSILLSQNNLGDSKNETAIGVPGLAGGVLSFNVIEKKIIFDYGRISKNRHNFLNFKIIGPIDDDISELISKGSFVPDMSYGFKMGFSLIKAKNNEGFFVEHVKNLMKKPNFKENMNKYLETKYHPIISTAKDLWILFNANYSPQKYKLFYPKNPYKDQIKDERYNGYGFDLGINYWTADLLNMGSSFTLGASIGIQRANNKNIFDEKEIETFIEYTDELTGEIRRIKAKTLKAFNIEDSQVQEYEERNEIPLKIDIYVNPHFLKSFGFYAYSRWFFQSLADYSTRKYIGGGIYFFKDRDPLNTIGGLICEIIDKLDLPEDEQSFKNRIKVFLTLGIKLFGPPIQ